MGHAVSGAFADPYSVRIHATSLYLLVVMEAFCFIWNECFRDGRHEIRVRLKEDWVSENGGRVRCVMDFGSVFVVWKVGVG